MYRKFLLLTSLFFVTILVQSQVSVVTQHNDLLRSGWNNKETKLTPSNVNVRQFGTVFKATVDDQLYAQPLVAGNIIIGGKKRNVVYAATVNNTIYAIDGDSGTVYWSKNYTPASQRPPKNTDMTGACGGNYNDFSGNMGIVGTPVIDSATQLMYFVARSISSSRQFYQYLHAIDIKTGNEKSGSPVLITASVSGNGSGSANNIVSFDPQKNNQRQALTLYNGKIFITYSSHCDWGPYHGWILGYDAATLQQKSVYNATPNGYNAGIWQSGGGPSVDANGNMYIVTGNGSVGYNGNLSDVINRGESALKLSLKNDLIKVTDFFTPKNYQSLENADLDYGSMAAFLIPNSNLYLTGCKDGNLYVLDTANLGGYNASSNNVKQTIALGSNITLRCQPSYYRSATKEFVYVWSENSQLKAYPVDRTADNLNVANLVTGSAPGPTGANGAVLSTSSNNGADGSGIVWASYAANGDANQSVRPGILRAFDANDITRELWNSNQNAGRDAVGNYAKFSAPTIANGKVYLPTFSNQLIAYGIVDSSTQNNCINNLALNQPAVASSIENSDYTAAKAVDDNLSTRWSSAYSDPQWIYVDLGQRDSICNITLQWETALGKDFKLQVADDTTHWATISTVTGNTAFINSINVKTAGRYVRMYGTKRGTSFGYSLYEFQVYGSLINGCTVPTGVTVNSIDTTSAVIRWTKTATAVSYNIQYKLSSTSTWTTKSTTADTLKLTNLSCSNYYDYRVQSVCGGGSTSDYSQPGSFNTLTCSNCGFLPTRYYTTDVGNVGVGGEACFTAPNTYNLKGAGKDVGGTADAFRFVYKTFKGNGKVEAQVFAQDSASPANKAGVMFRASLDSGANNVFLALTSSRGLAAQARKTTGGATESKNQSGIKAPYFVRIVKSGTLYKGYISADGTLWTLVSSVTIPTLGANGEAIYAGLAVTSHDNKKLSAATFKQVKIVFDSTAAKAADDVMPVASNMIAARQAGSPLSLYVYPNPATDNFTVSFNVPHSQQAVVSIAGLGDGRIYYTESLTNYEGTYHKDNATFKLRKGVYVIYVKTDAGSTSKVLIKE